jgi:hypothetical protein
MKFMVNGQEVSEEEFRKRETLHGGIAEMLKSRKAPGGHQPACWPQKSRSLGVYPDQAKEAYDESVRIGVPTEFDSEGHAIFRDQEHRRSYCKATGFMDLDGGYGDHTESNLKQVNAEGIRNAVSESE